MNTPETVQGQIVQWYRKYDRPWGHVIGYSDEAFLRPTEDSIVRVVKCYEDGSFKHYCCSTIPGGYSSGNWWADTWTEMLDKINKYLNHLIVP